jgi:hypothetical protein
MFLFRFNVNYSINFVSVGHFRDTKTICVEKVVLQDITVPEKDYKRIKQRWFQYLEQNKQ